MKNMIQNNYVLESSDNQMEAELEFTNRDSADRDLNKLLSKSVKIISDKIASKEGKENIALNTISNQSQTSKSKGIASITSE